MAAPLWAADLREPDPALSPADVVAIQLNALQTNDTPETDAGIAQTWAFAHPDNKRVTGPLPRFAQMIKGPLYQILLGHRSHEIREVLATGRPGRLRGDRHQPEGRGGRLSMERREGSRR